MSTAEQIEQAIENLPPREQDRLFLHLEEHYAARFDAQIARDFDQGRLDALIDAALVEAESGTLREW